VFSFLRKKLLSCLLITGTEDHVFAVLMTGCTMHGKRTAAGARSQERGAAPSCKNPRTLVSGRVAVAVAAMPSSQPATQGVLLLLTFLAPATTAALAASQQQQCPFCPHTATAKVFGAAASGTTISAMGQLTANQTYSAVASEGMEMLDSNVYKCSDWKALPARLAAAAARGVQLIAGFESESRFGDYCPNFIGADGLVDWPGLAAQLANLSLAHPNLIGYRFDDFIGCCHLQPYGNFSSKPNPHVYYGGLPQDTAKMQAAAKDINPDFMMLGVFYDAQLAYQSPFSFSFGQRAWLQPAIPDQATAGHHGSFFPAGTTATMRVSFQLSEPSESASLLQLNFMETTDFLYDTHDIAAAQGLVRRRLTANGRCCLLDHDLANITDSLFPPSTPQVVDRIFVHSLTVNTSCLNSGWNVLEWELIGLKPLSDWSPNMPHKNFVSLWDIELAGPMVPGTVGTALVGNGSWANVTFELDDSGSAAVPPIDGQTPQLFGGSNRPFSQLPQMDGILLCWKQMDPLWGRDHGGPEQVLYRRLLRSARRAFAGPDAVPGRKYSLFSTHFGMFDWRGWDSAVAQNPALPRAGISPQTVRAQMMDDAWLSDGVFIWWDLIGLSQDVAAQRGIFAQQKAGRHTVLRCPENQSYQYLQLKTVEGIGLLRGWYQGVTSEAPGVAGSVTISMIQGYDEILTVGFRTVVQLRQSDGASWTTVYQRGSNESCAVTACNQSASKHVPALHGCSVSCMNATTMQVTLKLSQQTMVRARLEVIHDAGGNLGVCVNAVARPASGRSTDELAWSFYSGIDSSVSTVLEEEQAIVNATKLIQTCTCDDQPAGQGPGSERKLTREW
jgi:hypothetical protein